MIITISGMPGSGKSTVGKLLAKKLGYRYYSMGDLYGELGMRRGMTIDGILKQAETDASIDRYIDDRQTEIGAGDNAIVDSLIGFHFIPHSFKLFIDVDPVVAGERVFKNQRPDEPPVKNTKEATTMLMARPKTNEKRWKKYYGISYLDRSHYDLVLDSTSHTPDELVKQILAALPKK